MAEISDADEWPLDVVEQIASPKAKIQRVPALLGRIPDFNKYCKPTIISFGPIHHRDEDLKVGQQFKIQWTSQYIEEYSGENNISASKAEHSLYKVIEDNIGELKKLFSEDVIKAYNDEELARMLFSDGCNFKCCSYLSFMDSLIDDAEDAKELRLAGVIQNLLGSDEDVAKLFNELGRCLPTHLFNYVRSDAVAYSKIYVEVKLQIEKHYKKLWNKWLAEARSTYFKTPWSLLAFLAALLGLLLTFIQAWYAIQPN